MKESNIERAVVRHCKSRGLLCYKFSSPAHRGVPDRIILGPHGKVLFLELKAPGKRLSLVQYREILKMLKLGLSAFWTDDSLRAIEIIDRTFP